LLEGVEQRVPEAMAHAPSSDKPARRTGQFAGYTIVGSLRGGGSGAKLYIAEPDQKKRNAGMPERVVIKSFALTEGSSLPQIIRESRALEAARQLGLVLDHDMEEHRFFYVMPFHNGEHLGIMTRQFHGESDGRGLTNPQLASVMGYTRDLLHTLTAYHKGGLWHKDVKPENIIIHDHRAHLVDLGLVTPLRSAMTLTTHGTEYFRDPEMVRQALRGVRVHQVDGAKFDIYAVGAVLYFVMENTFPAHGGLSRFKLKSPEALRWIVKRSMTDYNQRYETADEVLADLAVVMSADDPFAVKPASLPSMSGGMSTIEEAQDEVAQVYQAATPHPKPQAPVAPVAPVADFAPVAGVGPTMAAAATPVANPVPRVTNWWTGAYTVDDSNAASPEAHGFAAEAEEMRKEARTVRQEGIEMRQEVAQMAQQVRMGAMSARKAAREQIKAARNRAKEIRQRARNHRRAAYAPSQKPSPFLGFLVLGVLVVGGLLSVVMVSEQNDRPSQSIMITGMDGNILELNGMGLEDLEAVIADLESEFSNFDVTHASTDLPLLLVNDHPAKINPKVEENINEMVDAYVQRGWEISVNEDAEVQIRRELPIGAYDTKIIMSNKLQAILKEFGLAGVLWITSRPGEGETHERIADHLLLSHEVVEAANGDWDDWCDDKDEEENHEED
jgi:serine/threonine protein kinase